MGLGVVGSWWRQGGCCAMGGWCGVDVVGMWWGCGDRGGREYWMLVGKSVALYVCKEREGIRTSVALTTLIGLSLLQVKTPSECTVLLTCLAGKPRAASFASRPLGERSAGGGHACCVFEVAQGRLWVWLEALKPRASINEHRCRLLLLAS